MGTGPAMREVCRSRPWRPPTRCGAPTRSSPRGLDAGGAWAGRPEGGRGYETVRQRSNL